MDNSAEKLNKNKNDLKKIIVNSKSEKTEEIEVLEIESVSTVSQEDYKSNVNNDRKEKLENQNNKEDSISEPLNNNDKKNDSKDDNFQKKNAPKLDNNNKLNNNENSNNASKDKENNKNEEIKDSAKKAASQAIEPIKEQGKNAAAKVGGVALSAATGGVIPPKVGELVSKVALDQGEKIIKEKAPEVKQKVNNVKNKVEKNSKIDTAKKKVKSGTKKVLNKAQKVYKAVKLYLTIKKWGPVIVSGLAIAFIVFGFASVVAVIQTYLPGSIGDVEKEVESENYTNRDQKILKKIENISRKYPNADGPTVMAAVAYPYYELVQSDDVKAQLKSPDEKVDPNAEDEKSIYEQMELLFEDDDNLTWNEKLEKYKLEFQTISGITGELVGSALDEFKEWTYEKFGWEYSEESEEEEPSSNDMYLNLYAKKEYRDKYEELMKIYNDSGKEAYEAYLKETYFKSDDGYKKLLKKVPEEDVSDVAEEVILDIEQTSELYDKYIPDIKICSVSMQSAGTIEVSDIIKNGNILIDVKEESCTSNSDIDSCQSQSNMPISLKDYVFGVVNTEISVSESTPIEKIKTQMLMVKSVVLGRYKEMGWEIKQNEDGSYVIPIRSNTNDQDYCDYTVGCIDKLSGNTHGAASQNVIELYEQAWEDTVDEYIFDSSSNRTSAYYRNGNYGPNCPQGKCLLSSDFDVYVANGLTYQQIIATAYSDYQLITLEGGEGFATIQVPGVEQCVTVSSGNGGIPDNQFIYYDQKNYKDPFCGRTDDSTISSSGCGVTSMAMVIANITYENEINPVDTMLEAQAGGYCGDGIIGTMASYFWNASEIHGLTIENLAKDSVGIEKIKQTLKNGGLVIANVKENSPFTTGGHYIVLRKIDENGYVYVADPNHSELFNTPYDLNQFINDNWLGNGGWQSFIGPKSPEFASKITSVGDPGVATGYLGNMFNPEDTQENYNNQGNARYFPKYSGGTCHGGVDLPIGMGTKVYAMDGGVVSQINNYNTNCYSGSCGTGNNSYGNLVVIDHGNGYLTRYAHLSKMNVQKGDIISKGQLIGYSGNTGKSSGPHLHIELEKTDLLNENGREVAKCTSGKGLLNPTKFINSSETYVGKLQ